jgi:hypothetical protein
MVEDGGPVGGGGSNPRYITDEDGQRWIMKGTFLGGQDHAYLRLNEGLCSLIARRLNVPVPQPAAVLLTLDQLHGFRPSATSSEGVAFASLRIDPREAIAPETAASCDRFHLASIVAFDALVLNTDRKPEHVLVQETAGQWHPWAVDHGHTLATAHTLAGNFDASRPCSPPMDLLAANITASDLEPALEAIEGLSAYDVHNLIQSLPGEWVIEPDTPELLSKIVERRARTIRALLEPHFPGVSARS